MTGGTTRATFCGTQDGTALWLLPHLLCLGEKLLDPLQDQTESVIIYLVKGGFPELHVSLYGRCLGIRLEFCNNLLIVSERSTSLLKIKVLQPSAVFGFAE